MICKAAVIGSFIPEVQKTIVSVEPKNEWKD